MREKIELLIKQLSKELETKKMVNRMRGDKHYKGQIYATQDIIEKLVKILSD